ncbi:unnamed protein product, partial [Choristocarpus tenellus]
QSRAILRNINKDGQKADIPTSVQEIVSARIDTLDASVALVLKMSYTAYGMLLHSYRWRLHYRVASVMTERCPDSFMVLAHHWIQESVGDPGKDEIEDLGGQKAFHQMLIAALSVISKAVQKLLGMGQFIDASLFFIEGLGVMEKVKDSPEKDKESIGLLLQGCQLTQFIEGYTSILLEYATQV